MSKAQRIAFQHQLSAAEEHGSVRYGLSRHPALVIAIKDRTIQHQTWAERYATYAREQLGISNEDQFFA
ncbi:hypothetical protein [Rhizobium leguminosarum]